MRLFDAEVIKGVSCAYRLCHEGLQHVLPHLGKQRAPCGGASLLMLMERGLLTAEEVQRDATLASALERCAAGSVVLVCRAAAAQQVTARLPAVSSRPPIMSRSAACLVHPQARYGRWSARLPGRGRRCCAYCSG